ncbi:MAG: 2-C-methyl-D-erythritol 4-phosphate cytidylyltransferase [Candidatus Eremiobacteraeota bacterium]|nr:2-C-methyl-D-erythritol 4-phosphate cytidylyltransferase [Candidatus Eremiobacteraeota bacterium]
MMRWAGLVVAAGEGRRFGGFKQLVEIAGRPMLAWSLEALASVAAFSIVAVVTAREAFEDVERVARPILGERLQPIVGGGSTRQESVRNGLRALAGRCDALAIHDGARPCVRVEEIEAGMREVAPGRAALLASRVVDTLKETEAGSLLVRATVARENLWGAQTPQFATYADLLAAHERAVVEGISATDDIGLLEAIGVRCTIVPSTAENLKVTQQSDRELAAAIFRARALRIGGAR